MCLIVLFSIFTIPARAVAITATTVGLSVLATGLVACGVVIATNKDFRTALNDVWNSMTDNLKQEINNVKVMATVTGTLVASWSAVTWNHFTSWLNSKFFTDGTSNIPVEFGGHTTLVHYMDSWDYTKAVKYTSQIIGVFKVGLSFIMQGEAVVSHYNYILNEKGFSANITNINNDVIFTSSLNTSFTSNFSSGYGNSVDLYKPTLYYTDTYGYNYATFGDVVLKSSTGTSHIRAQEFQWYINGTGNPTIDGQQIKYNKNTQTISFGTTGVSASGTYTGVADYIYKTVISAGAVGLPLYPGDDVINPADDTEATLPVEVYPDYYPGTGISALPKEIPQDGSIDIPIPTTKDEEGTICPDLDGTRDLTPDEVLPRIKTGDIVTDGTLDTDIADSFPIEDVSIPDLPDSVTNDRNAKKFKFPSIAITKFPFCIPFDVKNAFSMLLAEAEVPEFNYKFVIPSINYEQTINISLEKFEPIAKICRWMFSALFIFMLIIATKRLIK